MPELKLSGIARVSDFVTIHAIRTPDAESMVIDEERTSYLELSKRIDAVARALIAAGVRKGDRVATLSTPHPDYLVTFLASASIGAIWLGLNPRYRVEELKYAVADAAPRILFARRLVGDRCFDADLAAMRAVVPDIGMVVQLDREPLVAGAVGWASFVAAGERVDERELAEARDRCGDLDPCLLVYTSGSTGRPKGALLHHRGIVEFSLAQNRVWPVARQRFLNFLPINHIGCVVDVSCPTLAAGGSIVFMEQFSPGRSLELMHRERVNVWGSVPSVFQMQLGLPDFDQYDLSAMELILWEGAAMPEDLIRRLRVIVPRLATNYGMTETLGITVLPPTDDMDLLANSVGAAFEGVEIRLVGEDGAPVPAGQPGEVQVRSVFNMLGYFNRPSETAAAFTPDGWFRTGDLAVQRPDGLYRIVGRIKEMYKSGGYNVYPREIEDVIESHPAVQMAAVVGRPDDLWQEVGVAYVVLREPVSPDVLLEYCRDRLANYKVPKEVTICSEFPLLPIGKVDKIALRELATRRQAPG